MRTASYAEMMKATFAAAEQVLGAEVKALNERLNAKCRFYPTECGKVTLKRGERAVEMPVQIFINGEHKREGEYYNHLLKPLPEALKATEDLIDDLYRDNIIIIRKTPEMRMEASVNPEGTVAVYMRLAAIPRKMLAEGWRVYENDVDLEVSEVEEA